VFSTHTATDTPIWITGVIYAHGLRGLWYTFFTAWTAIGAFVSARIFRRSLAYTQAEWQSLRFDGLGAELLRGWWRAQVFEHFILGWSVWPWVRSVARLRWPVGRSRGSSALTASTRWPPATGAW
jgi:hypothetical protein